MPQACLNDPVRARGLAKRFGTVRAVSSIDLDVAPGEALGLLGPNGAGKSTTLSMLTGLRAPDAGEVLIFGHRAGSPQARALTGATPQLVGFPDQLSPREILGYAAARYRVRARTDKLAACFGLERLIDRRVAGFSGGEMRRLALALAFVGGPRLVFLDEPTTGLDGAAQEGFQEVTRDFVAKGGSLVLTSHHWDEIEAVCDSIALVDRGETVLEGRIGDIRKRANVSRLTFSLPPATVPPGWMHAVHDGARWHSESADSDGMLRRMVHEALPFQGLADAPLDLKDLIDRIRREETGP
ncbi:MAG: ABC transporter ATP-binding protein [Boseongicola sp. SB0667_bin_21]|nr:ABC transporter ATP-binding protein [Boseongicola sp. SB0667_bin_21]